MVGFGGAFAFRDWLRFWTERFDRLDAYLRKLQADKPDNTPPAGEAPDDHWHRRN